MVQDLKITHTQHGLFAQKTNHPSKWAERANKEINPGERTQKHKAEERCCSLETLAGLIDVAVGSPHPLSA